MMNIFANNIGDFFKGFWENTGIAQFFVADDVTVGHLVGD